MPPFGRHTRPGRIPTCWIHILHKCVYAYVYMYICKNMYCKYIYIYIYIWLHMYVIDCNCIHDHTCVFISPTFSKHTKSAQLETALMAFCCASWFLKITKAQDVENLGKPQGHPSWKRDPQGCGCPIFHHVSEPSLDTAEMSHVSC